MHGIKTSKIDKEHVRCLNITFHFILFRFSIFIAKKNVRYIKSFEKRKLKNVFIHRNSYYCHV